MFGESIHYNSELHIAMGGYSSGNIFVVFFLLCCLIFLFSDELCANM